MIKNECFNKILQILETENTALLKTFQNYCMLHPLQYVEILKKLEQDGLVSTCYGGVSLLQDPSKETPWVVRKNYNNMIKKHIAKKVATLIPNVATVLFDSSSAVSNIAEQLKTEQNITLITNGISADGQITDQSVTETELRLAMLANSDKLYFSNPILNSSNDKNVRKYNNSDFNKPKKFSITELSYRCRLVKGKFVYLSKKPRLDLII